MTTILCRAKNPATCPYHHRVKVPDTTVTSLQEKIRVLLDSSSTNGWKNGNEKEFSAKLFDNALNSSLEYDGEKPVWWDTYEETVVNDKRLPATVTLVDVVNSPVGPLAVVWQTESQEAHDQGINLGSGYEISVCYYKSMKTGETLGYIKIASVNDNSFERTFGDDEFTSFRWDSRFGGGHYNFNDDEKVYGDRNLIGEALLEKRREVWVTAMHSLRVDTSDVNGNYVAHYNVNKTHLPDDAQVKKDLEKFSKKLDKPIRAAKACFKIPYVDFSRVSASLKGKGFGTALYVYAARMLGKENKILRGSGVQSNDALGVWGRFQKRLPDKISSVEITYKGTTVVHPVLDFIEKA